MRARNIKPGFFTNEELCSLPFATRLLFEGLWLVADREGRLEDRPKRIHVEVFPYDRDLNVDEMLDELDASGFIARYEVDDGKYIQVINFSKHQNPHKRETPSTIKAMPGHRKGPAKARPRHVQDTTKAMSSPADSLIPDSLIPDSSDSLIQVAQPKKAARAVARPKSSPSNVKVNDLMRDEETRQRYWAISALFGGTHVRNPKPTQTAQAFQALIDRGANADQILNAARKYAQSSNGPQYMTGMLGWLENGGWQDEPTLAPSLFPASSNQGPQTWRQKLTASAEKNDRDGLTAWAKADRENLERMEREGRADEYVS